MSTSGPEPTEEEMRADYEAELKKIRVEHVLLEQVVMLVNLGMRRTGLAPGTESERDLAQVQLAIEAIRAELPLIEQAAPQQAGQIREALSQLQLAYVRIGGQAPGPTSPPPGEPAAPRPSTAPPSTAPPAADPGPAQTPAAEPGPSPVEGPLKPGEAGPAQRSGRLWIPGQ